MAKKNLMEDELRALAGKTSNGSKSAPAVQQTAAKNNLLTLVNNMASNATDNVKKTTATVAKNVGAANTLANQVKNIVNNVQNSTNKAGSANVNSKGGNTSENLQNVQDIIGSIAANGVTLGGQKTQNKNNRSSGENGNTGGNGGGNGGGGSGAAAAAAPAVQATAQGSVQTQTPTAAQIAAALYTRPEMAAYQESQQVQDALANLNAILQGQPGAYTQSQAVTDLYNAMIAAQQGQPGAYQESQRVQDAYNQLMGLQNNQPGAYTPSQAVLDAQAALQNLNATKPQGYNSKYQPQLDQLLQQIMNPGQFNYEFNGDNLFKMYADEYTQRGKQASMDAMGQAAALTGGYGNSYAQQVGNQAYDQYLTQLYDKGLELRDRAYEKFLDEENRKINQYDLLNAADQNEYGRYRDTVGDWNDERKYLSDMYNNERTIDYNQFRDQVGDWFNNRGFAADLYNSVYNQDYNQYIDQLNNWKDNRNYATEQYNNAYNKDYNQYLDMLSNWKDNRNFAADQYNQLSNVDYSRYADARDMAEKQYEYDTNMQENVRQFNENLDWEKMSQEQKLAADYAMQILANGQMPSEAMLRAAGLSAEDAQKMMAQIAASGGTGGSKKENEYYYLNGKYYKQNKDNSWEEVSKNDIQSKDIIDTKLQRTDDWSQSYLDAKKKHDEKNKKSSGK